MNLRSLDTIKGLSETQNTLQICLLTISTPGSTRCSQQNVTFRLTKSSFWLWVSFRSSWCTSNGVNLIFWAFSELKSTTMALLVIQSLSIFYTSRFNIQTIGFISMTYRIWICSLLSPFGLESNLQTERASNDTIKMFSAKNQRRIKLLVKNFGWILCESRT